MKFISEGRLKALQEHKNLQTHNPIKLQAPPLKSFPFPNKSIHIKKSHLPIEDTDQINNQTIVRF